MPLDMTIRQPAAWNRNHRPRRDPDRTIEMTRSDVIGMPSLEGAELIKWAAGEERFEYATAHRTWEGGLELQIWDAA